MAIRELYATLTSILCRNTEGKQSRQPGGQTCDYCWSQAVAAAASAIAAWGWEPEAGCRIFRCRIVYGLVLLGAVDGCGAGVFGGAAGAELDGAAPPPAFMG